jgi:DNA-binding MarR family transcriptional regulator
MPLFSALQHPLRWSVLAYLQEHGEGSASDVAARLGMPVASLAYHVRRLAILGLIEEVATVHVRGAVKRVYRTTQKYRDAVVAMLSEEIVRLAAIAYPDIGPAAIASLDEQALGELSDDMERLFARVDVLRAQTAARATLSRTPLATVPVAVLFAIGQTPSL